MKSKALILYCLGMALCGLMIGYITAVSESPIASTVVTSVFGGVIGAVAGFLTTKRESPQTPRREQKESEQLFAIWGLSLSLFSALFIAGTLGGGWLRERWTQIPEKTVVSIPWEVKETKPPQTPQDAWTWLTFSKDAAALGVSETQIKSIYAASLAAPAPAAQTPPPQVGSATPTPKTIAAAASTPSPTWPSYTSPATPQPASHGGGGGRHGIVMFRQD